MACPDETAEADHGIANSECHELPGIIRRLEGGQEPENAECRQSKQRNRTQNGKQQLHVSHAPNIAANGSGSASR